MNYIIGIDLGTSSVKTVLFDQQMHVISSAAEEYPLIQPQNGWAEQNPEDWVKATFKTLKMVIDSSRVPKESIVGIGLSGQMHGLVMLDEKNSVIRPAILWCDQRTEKECVELTNLIGRERLVEITANPALTGFTASKILWVKNHEPENFSRCRHILLPKDYIRFVLTGEYATEVSDASGMQLLDVIHRCWSEEVIVKLGIDVKLLPKVYESPEVTGRIVSAVAEKTGLQAGTIVVGGAGDNAAAAIGTGTVKDGSAFATIGTSGVVYAHSSRPLIDSKGRVHTFCAAVPGCWHVMGVTQAAGLSLKWFRDQFCEEYIRKAEEEMVDPYVLMDREAKTVPPGSNHLLYLPYLMGERTPHLDPNCRGVFFGLSASHTKKDLLRAVMEGVSFSLKDCYTILAEMGLCPNQLVACGGGGTSSLWRQMIADMFSCTVVTAQSNEGPAQGAAILAGVGAGLFDSVEAACDEFCKTGKTCSPIFENTQKYNDIYPIYQSLYSILKDTFTRFSDIPL